MGLIGAAVLFIVGFVVMNAGVVIVLAPMDVMENPIVWAGLAMMALGVIIAVRWLWARLRASRT